MITLSQIRQAVAQIAPRYKIHEVELFGSYATGRVTARSDVDLLVTFTENPISLLEVFGFQEEASRRLNVPVDVVKSPVGEPRDPNFSIGKTINVYQRQG
ncbi:MAG: nucleotidyltransferase domain-containing protein [Bifidobacteriaceae bacterium]|jgi:predicted nucleotidyltransferase|nr:nucleotidyltransferase domain-containing protein [Bifidobacteriaceae bacterium]